MITAADIDLQAETYRQAQDRLHQLLAELRAAQDSMQRERTPGIRRAVIEAKRARAELAASVRSAPELFVRPKSRQVHGIEVGFRKQPDAWQWPDDPKLCAQIRKVLPDQAEVLIEIKESPVRRALKQLNAALVRKLGILIRPGRDEVLCKPVDGEVDKLLALLMGDLKLEEETGQ
jgi:hypothetical protein